MPAQRRRGRIKKNWTEQIFATYDLLEEKSKGDYAKFKYMLIISVWLDYFLHKTFYGNK